MPFEINFKEEAGVIVLSLSGHLDEFVELPEIEVSGKGTIKLDLEKVQSVNSMGIRSWLEWIKNFEGKAHFIFSKAPKCFVMQMNMVEGFLPKGSMVESFYVPFYCETCDNEVNLLVNVATDILWGDEISLKIDKKKVCKQDCDIEIDVNEVKYFKFLKDNESVNRRVS